MGEWYHLITNNEWMTIARNIEANPENWANGIVWSTVADWWWLFRGNVNLNDSVSCNHWSVLDWDTDWNNCLINEWIHEWRNKRMHILSNGSEIWDLSWNVWQHVNGANTLDGSDFNTMTNKACVWGKQRTWYDWYWENECDFQNWYSKSAHGPAWNYNWNHGVGRIYLEWVSEWTNDIIWYNNRIFLRGGRWNYTTSAGVLLLNLTDSATYARTHIGFRCVFRVIQ